MSGIVPRLAKDREEIIVKFAALIRTASTLHNPPGGYTTEQLVQCREVRASALNLLARVSSTESIYYRELSTADFTDHLALRGILEAARADYDQGFMADTKLLLAAEVFTDFLVQAEVLLEHDYHIPAAVLIRAVLEDGLRRLCVAHAVDIERRDSISQLNEKLYRAHAYTALQHKEIIAKAETGNAAAHGRFSECSRADVEDLLRFVSRFLAEYLR
jgi:hypothetical protein